MNRKFSLGVCISLVAIACAVTFVLTMNLSLNMYNRQIAGVGEREVINAKLQNIDSYVRTNVLKAIDEDRLAAGIMSGYMAGLGDNKARYITASENYEFQQRTRGRIITAGVQVARDESGYIIITDVYDGSSAKLLGIEAGDLITQIDGVSVLEVGAESAIRLLSGEEGARVVLMTRRDGEDRRFTLMRQEVELVSVRGTVYEDYGFIRITGFSENTGDQFEAMLNELTASGIGGLIIDLRGASGCVTAPMRQILERLLPRGASAVGEYRNGDINNIIEITGDSFTNLPLTVITDGSTAEGGELLAAMLKDYAGAQLVGAPTKGDSVFTLTQMLRDGSAVTFSNMRVRSGGGTSFDGEGIKPDFPVEAVTSPETNLENLENTLDSQIRKALEITETRIHQ
ncbi:MAG: S41 family peptidase [Oscillospiraceae bacterium]|nr:S41 family peptidase [Oscillospiraceae bacterium]